MKVKTILTALVLMMVAFGAAAEDEDRGIAAAPAPARFHVLAIEKGPAAGCWASCSWSCWEQYDQCGGDSCLAGRTACTADCGDCCFFAGQNWQDYCHA